MLRFAEPDYLYLLISIPLFVLLYWYVIRKEKKYLWTFAGDKLHKVLFPDRSLVKSWIKFILILTALLFAILGLANPQIGTKIEEVKQQGIDVYIVLDVSLSMVAEDIKPSRLDKAKNSISRLIQKLRGDRIGLIIFSGDAYIQIPLTSDYSAADLFLNAVDVSSVPQPGTAIASALNLARTSFKKDEQTKKAIIIITDGEDHEGDIESAVKDAVSEGIQIYTIGMGSTSGVPIPVYNQSGIRVDYKKDRSGSIVLTKLDEETLKTIASDGNGKYYRSTTTSEELGEIYDDLSKLEQTEYGSTRVTDYEDRFYYLLIPVIFLLFWEIFIPSGRSKFMRRFED